MMYNKEMQDKLVRMGFHESESPFLVLRIVVEIIFSKDILIKYFTKKVHKKLKEKK